MTNATAERYRLHPCHVVQCSSWRHPEFPGRSLAHPSVPRQFPSGPLLAHCVSCIGGCLLNNYLTKRRKILNYEDRTLSCVECGQSFTFSADDQAYHADRGYSNEPKRCPDCRQARRAQRGGGGGGGYNRSPREMHPVVCAECGKDTTVPFRPRGDRPVYCNDCFRQQRTSASAGRY